MLSHGEMYVLPKWREGGEGRSIETNDHDPKSSSSVMSSKEGNGSH